MTVDFSNRVPTSHVRWMIRNDMPAVMRIENESFEYTWSEEDFYRVLRGRNCIGMVAERDEEVVGFMLYELEANRIILLNFAVSPQYRREGIGLDMMQKLFAKLCHQRRQQIWLNIRESNLTGQQFFRWLGFRAVQILRNPWPDDCDEDAYRMVYSLDDCGGSLIADRLHLICTGERP